MPADGSPGGERRLGCAVESLGFKSSLVKIAFLFWRGVAVYYGILAIDRVKQKRNCVGDHRCV